MLRQKLVTLQKSHQPILPLFYVLHQEQPNLTKTISLTWLKFLAVTIL